MRGYGGTSSPKEWQMYNVYTLAGDALAVMHHLGYTHCALVGHDNGASLAWHLALLYPSVFPVFIPMSVAYADHETLHLVPRLIAKFGDPAKKETKPQFHYILHHQLPDAHRDYEMNPREALYRAWLFHPDFIKECTMPEILSNDVYCGPKGEAVGMWRRMPRPRALPSWMSQKDLGYYVEEFERSGFHGGVNWYKSLYTDFNWTITSQLRGARVKQPTLFVAGEIDYVVKTQGGPDGVRKMLSKSCENVESHFLRGVGHWLQAQAPEAVNKLLVDFLNRHKDKIVIRRSAL